MSQQPFLRENSAIMPKITLKQLAVFVSIYQLGSTSRASAALNLSQSAVSSALMTLEERLQMPLFERVGRALNPHPNAQAIFIQAQAILGQAQTLEHYYEHKAGQLTIGASTTIGGYVLPEMLAGLYQKMPDADIKLVIANTQEIVTEVEQLNIDIALVEGTPRPEAAKAIERKAWRTDTLVLFAKPNSQWLDNRYFNSAQNCYQLTQEKLAKQPLLVREMGSGTRQIIDEQLLKQLPETINIMAIQQSEAIKNMVLADIGIGCLSQFVIENELAAQTLVQVKVAGINLERLWWLVWHKARHQSPIWQQFIDLAIDESIDP